MRIAIGADHAGFTMKEEVAALLRELGHDVVDVGAHHSDPSDDYPDFAEAVGKATGRPGICFVTRGPGATNASPGIHIARQDSTPLIVFVGQVARGMREREGAWTAFASSRAEYATGLNALARYFAVPPALWISDRSGLPHMP